ncbi:MAG TPA: hypothetical protein PLJ35_15190 [Anaerolineae bacterium]|nr:hypothetical protein [Anaerolineae bacterium]HPL27455.1 hypothetical protein [Anaerolineae bacterium]
MGHLHRYLDQTAGLLLNPALFSSLVIGVPLRSYQLQVAQAVLDSVLNERGLTFAVMMSRQAGKNETAAQIEALLLLAFQHSGGFLVKASPTFQPQTINSIQRLQARLQNPLTRGRWHRERGYMLRLGEAHAIFLSAQPEANVMGATASILLEADEAQDISEEKWDKEFRPMGASTNVTTVLWGTAWTPDTLLAHTVRALRRLEEADGVQRVFAVPWPRVAAEVPAYRAYVQGEIARLGAAHPLIRTQYALEEIDAAAAMFPPARRALMQGEHPPHAAPVPGASYALTVDVAGESPEGETAAVGPGARDCSACTLFAVAPAAPEEPLAGKPRYLVVRRWWWRGLAQTELYERLLQLAETWAPRHLVVDATGIGAGVASFLAQRLGERVQPFTFSGPTKSRLGWSYLAICDTGRFKDHVLTGCAAQAEFWRQTAAADYEVLPGPGQGLRWGVPPARGHDDLLVAAALCAALEGVGWGAGESHVVPQRDPLDDIDQSAF